MSKQSWSGLPRVIATCIATVAVVGCATSEKTDDPALPDAALVDAGIDTIARDGSTADAAADTGLGRTTLPVRTECYSPLQTPDAGRGTSSQGCECIPTPPTSYCINSLAVFCSQGQKEWLFAVDGACFPPRMPAPLGACQSLGGELIARGATCPSGFETRYGYYRVTEDAGVGEYDDCCYPIEVPAQNCTNAGLTVLPAGTQGASPLATRCSNGGSLRAIVVGQPVASLCCTP